MNYYNTSLINYSATTLIPHTAAFTINLQMINVTIRISDIKANYPTVMIEDELK